MPVIAWGLYAATEVAFIVIGIRFVLQPEAWVLWSTDGLRDSDESRVLDDFRTHLLVTRLVGGLFLIMAVIGLVNAWRLVH